MWASFSVQAQPNLVLIAKPDTASTELRPLSAKFGMVSVKSDQQFGQIWLGLAHTWAQFDRIEAAFDKMLPDFDQSWTTQGDGTRRTSESESSTVV